MASQAQMEQINKILSEAVPEAKVRSSTSKRIIIESDVDRNDIKKRLESYLASNRIQYDSVIVKSVSSFPVTDITNYDMQIGYKNSKGGMSETTLNSTITELFPCIAFLRNIQPTGDVREFYKNILMNNKEDLPCYLGNDGKKGKEFVDKAETSTKFNEKVNGALGVLKYIKQQAAGKRVQNIYWAYRTKPPGVDNNHKGDIFLKFDDGKMLGVSIKSGSESSAEPQLNTFVRPILEKLGMKDYYQSMEKEAYERFYSDIPDMPEDYKQFGSKDFMKALVDFEKNSSQEYEKRYNALLEFVKDKLIKALTAHEAVTKKWILNAVAGEQEDVPLVVVKTIESSGSYEIKKDSDIVKACVMRSKNSGGLSVKKSQNKQDFSIDLTCKAKTTTLKFSVRTNKPGVFHKLGQGINLAVKFNGVKK